MTTELKTRTITLTGRAPIKVIEADWPIIAQATGNSYAGSDYARRSQALHRGECDKYGLYVRQHPDGRTIVYCVLDAAIRAWSQPAMGEDFRGGELLDGSDDVAAAIRRVAEACPLPGSIIRDCIAALPPQDLL